ncbi:MAG: RimK family alpha-L-glutamate ligase, partial [Pseudohongiellaceae bacterium]
MVLSRGKDTAHLRLLAAAFESRSLPFDVLSPGRFAQLAQAGWPGQSPPTTALLRLPSGVSPDDLNALAVAACSGETRWIDAPQRVAAVHDKALCLETLAAAGLPVPPTVVVRRDQALDLSTLDGESFVVKPIRGSSGRGVTVGLSRGDASLAALAYAELCGPALVQPLLGGGIDRRLVLLGGQLVGAMERVPLAEDGRGNTVYGATARRVEPSADEIRLAQNAAQCLGLSIAGVDLLNHEGSPIVLEVNTCPGLAAFVSATGIDLAGALVDLVLTKPS